MRFRVKDYCRIILYLPTEDKLKSSYAPQKPKRIEDDVDMRLSEDEAPIEAEDAQTTTTTHHRPPSYNPEDYAHALTKYSRASNLYNHDPKDKKNRGKDKDKSSNKDSGVEMTLKQFASLPELLRRLREDLKTAYVSFVKEFVRDPHDGVSLLVDLLKMIQLAQSNLSGSSTNREQQIALRRTLIDEFECLSCLRCCLRCADAAPRLANYRNGLYCLAAATMSSLTRSRTIALQLLTKACENSVAGHRQVVEAFSTLRLRFAEPVRCKFLVSMMLSYPHPSFQVWGLKMVNALLSSAVSLKERIYLQEELGEAGFDSAAIRKALEHRGAATPDQQEAVRTELDKWNEGYIDLTSLEDQLTSLKSSNMTLKQELQHLRQANMKLLEENVLVKTVGGEVEERCAALKRRLEKHGIPSAPSPTPSVTDSEVSSFVNTDRSTVKRNNGESPNRTMEFSPASTMDTICGPEGERSMSLEWKMIRPPPEGRGLNRVLSQGHHRDGNELLPPVPKKRQLFTPPELDSTRSLYVNDYCPQGYKMPNDRSIRTENGSQVPNEPSRNKDQMNGKPLLDRRTKDAMVDASFGKPFSGILPNGSTNEEKSSKGLNAPKEEEHIYQSPVKPARPKYSKSPSPKSMNGSADEKEDLEKNLNKGGRRSSVKSLSSSTSSLSVASSSASFDGGDRKDQGDHEYENLPKKDPEKQGSKNSSKNNSNNSSMSHKSTNTEKRTTISKSRSPCDEGEIEYERDVVVYEAITLGNDTILFDKNNTSGSDGSNNSKDSKNSKKSDSSIDGGPCVKQSVKHYENLVNMGEIREEVPNGINGQGEEKVDNGKGIFNGLINGLKNHKRKDSKSGKMDAPKNTQITESKETSPVKNDDVSEREVEAVMNGFENILRSAESSMSLASLGTVKENPLLKEHFEDRASPDQPVNEIEIVPTRVPQIPPRSRSRGTSSQSSRSRTPDPVVFLESPSETSDTEIFHNQEKDPMNPVTMDASSTRSNGWVRGDLGIRRRDTFVERSPDKNFHRQYGLRRCESVNMNNLKEYNSHRSYSPRRRGSTDHQVPLEENEIQISGRKYTQYTASEVERRNEVNNRISSEMKRRRNRSFDDRLDRWLDEDFQRQQKYAQEIPQEHSRHSRRTSSRSHDRRNPPPPPKPSRHSKSRYTANEINAYKNGLKHQSSNGLRESDYGPNFILNSPPHPHRLEEVLNDLVDFSGKTRNGRYPRKMLHHEDPAIPTPDYTATPAGTLTNENLSASGRHILEIASGLY